MSENNITSAAEPVEVIEITKEAKLPDSRLMPMKCGWARREMYTYNHHELDPPITLFRLRERDCFVVGSDNVIISISMTDYGFCGSVNVTLVDRAEGRERSKTKLIPFSLGNINLPMTSSTGDLMYRSEDVSLDFLRAPDKWYIRMYFDRFDDVRSLYINMTVDDVGGDSAFSAIPVGKRFNRFLLRHGLYAMPVSGKAVLGADVYELFPETSVGWLERERSDGGKIPEYSRITLSGRCGGVNFGLCVSEGGVFAAENTLIVNGKASRLENVSIEREDGVWYVSTADGRIQLYMPVSAARSDLVKLGTLRAERQREYGICLGELNLSGERYVIDSALGCGERTMCKC